MKKTLVLIGMVMATSASAVVNVTWNGSGITDDMGAPAPASYFAQLIWTQDAALPSPADEINEGDVLAAPAGDFVLASQVLTTFPITGTLVGLATPYVFNEDVLQGGGGPASIVGGYLYTRVFSSSSPTAGDFYAVSSNVTGNPNSGPGGITTSLGNDINTQNTHNPTGLAVNNVIMAIPEPSVFGLALVGFGLVLKRIKRD